LGDFLRGHQPWKPLLIISLAGSVIAPMLRLLLTVFPLDEIFSKGFSLLF
jgi:hypothetical protein